MLCKAYTLEAEKIFLPKRPSWKVFWGLCGLFALIVILMATFARSVNSFLFWSPYCLLLIVWIFAYWLMIKELVHIRLILTEANICYVRRAHDFIISWREIKAVKRSFDRAGRIRRAIIITHSGKYLSLINYADLEEIVSYVDQHAHSLGTLTPVEQIRLNPITGLFASVGVLAGFVVFLFFMRGVGLVIMLGSAAMSLWAKSTFGFQSKGSFGRYVVIFILVLIVWVAIGIAIVYIFNSMALHPHTHG